MVFDLAPALFDRIRSGLKLKKQAALSDVVPCLLAIPGYLTVDFQP